MKSFFLSLLLSLSFVTFSLAQGQANQCIPITGANYDDCCTTPFDNPTASRCFAYERSPQYCTDFPQDTRCRVINGPSGGTQQTGPINGGSDTTNSGGAGTQPQAGTVSIASCSNLELKSLLDILIWVKCIIMVAIIPLLFSLAFLIFLWGVFRFMAASDVKAKQEGQKRIWWGLLGLFVMVSLWGIIKILNTTLGIETTAVPMLKTEYLKK